MLKYLTRSYWETRAYLRWALANYTPTMPPVENGPEPALKGVLGR